VTVAQPPGIFTARWWRIALMLVRGGIAYRLNRRKSPQAHEDPELKRPASG
jgi:hypothetical protein